MSVAGGGGVNLDTGVNVTGSTISTSNADLTLSALTNVKVPNDLVLTNANGGNVTSASKALTLTGATGYGVNVDGINVLSNTVQPKTAAVLNLTAPASVAIQKELILTDSAGTGGKITTSVGGLDLTSSSGEVTVRGNLNVTGNVNSVNQTSTNVSVSDKVVFLASPAGVPVATWQFDSATPNTDTINGATLTTHGNAAFANGRLEITGSGGYASASSASWPSGTSGFQLSANFTPSAASIYTKLMSYGPFDIALEDTNIALSVGSDRIFFAGSFPANKTFKVALHRNTLTSKIHVLIND
eukprot:jgi/Mesvir1/14613/Mv05283-RA.1